VAIAAWNACHLTEDKLPLFWHNFGAYDIICIQEFGVLKSKHLQYVSDGVPSNHVVYCSEEKNGLATLFRSSLASRITDAFQREFWQAFRIVPEESSDFAFILLHVHLPDKTTSGKRGICLAGLLRDISAWVDGVRASKGCHAVMALGDFNVRLPVIEGVTGEACRFAEGLCDRGRALLDWAEKHGFSWNSTFPTHDLDPNVSHTHEHHVHKTPGTIDYVLLAPLASRPSSVDVCVRPDLAFMSDHFPLVTHFQFASKQGRKEKKRFVKDRVAAGYRRCLAKIPLANRFQTLLEETDIENMDIPTLSNAIVEAHSAASRTAVEELPPRDALREATREERSAVLLAEPGPSRREALNTLNKKKLAFLRERATDKLVRDRLREGRSGGGRAAGPHPLKCEGELTFDPEAWIRELRGHYEALFGDSANSVAIQESRLADLRARAQNQDRIVLPLALLCEVLARGRRKASSTPGIDGVCWGALACLPDRAICQLRALFEHRLNADENHCMVFEKWARALVTLIPKSAAPRSVGDWRPISVTSIVQKAYLACVIRLVNSTAVPLETCNYGFCAGRQTCEISEFVRNAVARKHSAGEPCFVMKLDARRAFDSMLHGIICDTLLHDRVPAALVHAIMLELHCCVMDLLFQGSRVEGVRLDKGGRQGGSDTPDLWVRLLNRALREAREIWSRSGEGLWIDEQRVDILVWADDVIMCSSSLDGLRKMFGTLTGCISKLGLAWKPGSMEVLTEGSDSLSWEGHAVKPVQKLLVLGTAVDLRGTTEAALEHRIAQGWGHYYERSPVLLDARLPLRLRFDRLAQTVYRTVLHGAGGWEPKDSVLNALSAFESKVMKLMLNRSPRDGESAGDFHHRLNAKLQWLRESFQWVPLTTTFLYRYCTWNGHVARCPPSMPIRIVTEWRSVEYLEAVAAARFPGGQPRVARYPARGRPKTHPEALLVECLGPFWRALAADRQVWREAVRAVLLPKLGLCGDGWDWRFSAHISNKCADILRGTRMLMPLKLVVMSDSLQVVSSLNGAWHVSQHSQWSHYITMWRQFERLFRFPWKFTNLDSESRMLVHRRRVWNSLADACVNDCLNSCRSIDEMACTGLALAPGACIVASCDGGSRGNPGPAAAAAVLQVVCGGSCCVVARRAFHLGKATNVQAEFEASLLVCRLLVDFLCSVKVAVPCR
jgi:ribonuclease HI